MLAAQSALTGPAVAAKVLACVGDGALVNCGEFINVGRLDGLIYNEGRILNAGVIDGSVLGPGELIELDERQYLPLAVMPGGS